MGVDSRIFSRGEGTDGVEEGDPHQFIVAHLAHQCLPQLWRHLGSRVRTSQVDAHPGNTPKAQGTGAVAARQGTSAPPASSAALEAPATSIQSVQSPSWSISGDITPCRMTGVFKVQAGQLQRQRAARMSHSTLSLSFSVSHSLSLSHARARSLSLSRSRPLESEPSISFALSLSLAF